MVKLFFLVFASLQILANTDKTLTFEHYLNQLEIKNISIKVKKNEIKKTEIELRKSYNSFLPKVDFTLGATVSSKNDNAFSKFLPAAEPKNPSWNRSLSISLPIFLGGKRFDIIKISSSNKKISIYELENTILELKSRAISFFIKAYKDQSQLVILKKSLELAKQNYDKALVLKSLGRMVKIDLLTFQLSYEERKNAILNKEMQLKNTFIDMSSLINSNMKVSSLNIDKNIPENIRNTQSKDLAELYIKKMRKLSPLVKKVREYKKISSYNLNISKKSFYPDLSMRYNYSPYVDNLWDFPLDKGHSLSLVLNFNIFNGFTNSLEYKKNKLNILNANFQLEELLKNQEYAIKKAVNVLKNSLNQMKSIKLSINLSKEKLEQIKIGYDIGKYDYLDLLKAENDWFSKQNNLLNLEMQIFNSFYQLEIISGNNFNKK